MFQPWFLELLSVLANSLTIIGVIFALITYLFWKKDHLERNRDEIARKFISKAYQFQKRMNDLWHSRSGPYSLRYIQFYGSPELRLNQAEFEIMDEYEDKKNRLKKIEKSLDDLDEIRFDVIISLKKNDVNDNLVVFKVIYSKIQYEIEDYYYNLLYLNNTDDMDKHTKSQSKYFIKDDKDEIVIEYNRQIDNVIQEYMKYLINK